MKIQDLTLPIEIAAEARRLADASHDGEASWQQLQMALEVAADEIERLQAEVERVRYQAIEQSYRLAGCDR